MAVNPRASDIDLVLEAKRQAARLGLFSGVLADDVGGAWRELLDCLVGAQASGQVDTDELALRYARLFVLLAAEAEFYPEPLVGDAWQNHLLDRLLQDENPLSRKAQAAAPEQMGQALVELARHELTTLRLLFDLDSARLCQAIHQLLRSLDGRHAADWLIAWSSLRPLGRGQALHGPEAGRLKRDFAAERDWSALAGSLVRHYGQAGSGVFARFRAFRWRGGEWPRCLEGVAAPDPIHLSELIGYDVERRLLIRNTEQFLAGYPANNVLLYGDRGTGKSSTIKALLNEYAERGLRLVEVPRHLLMDFPRLVTLLRDRREKFILFIDDLSFDEHETTYKALKAVLEGGLEPRPDNLLLYATSNRRHLVQERFSDRQSAANSDEIHTQDTAQEKLSLSDRFGITLTFLAPDQDKYLAIVLALAKQRGLTVSEDELAARALAWAARHNGRSGRTARQFVDQLTGELRLREERGEDG
ncbi:MAG: ATP-binding protein [Chloroflexota bacterium]